MSAHGLDGAGGLDVEGPAYLTLAVPLGTFFAAPSRAWPHGLDLCLVPARKAFLIYLQHFRCQMGGFSPPQVIL